MEQKVRLPETPEDALNLSLKAMGLDPEAVESLTRPQLAAMSTIASALLFAKSNAGQYGKEYNQKCNIFTELLIYLAHYVSKLIEENGTYSPEEEEQFFEGILNSLTSGHILEGMDAGESAGAFLSRMKLYEGHPGMSREFASRIILSEKEREDFVPFSAYESQKNFEMNKEMAIQVSLQSAELAVSASVAGTI